MQTKFEQLLDLLINEETEKANELFHEIVVEKSRDIYESLISEEEDTDKEDEDEKEDDKVDENLGQELTLEIGGDETDDFLGDIEVDGGEDDGMGGDDGMEFGDDEGEDGGEDIEDRVMDLEDALDELKAEFEALLDDEANEPEHNDGEEDPAFGGDDEESEEEPEESFMGESATLSKVAPVKHGDNGQNTKSIVAKPNNMGGTAIKTGGGAPEAGGVKGGLLKPTPKDLNTGNINTANGTAKAGDAFKKHAVPKTTDSASNKQSPLVKSHNK